MGKIFNRLKQNRLIRIPFGIILILIGILGGFIPILQGWIFILAGLVLIFGDRFTNYLKRIFKK